MSTDNDTAIAMSMDPPDRCKFQGKRLDDTILRVDALTERMDALLTSQTELNTSIKVLLERLKTYGTVFACAQPFLVCVMAYLLARWAK